MMPYSSDTYERVPHTRGDEPNNVRIPEHFLVVFPTPVGMNLINQVRQSIFDRVPHTRGDEPYEVGQALRQLECSPHPWG